MNRETTPLQETLAHPYIVWEDGAGDYSCEACGVTWAKENGLTEGLGGSWYEFDEHNNYAPNGRMGNELYCCPPWHDGETDTPQACSGCGVWLDVCLTPEAWEYMIENEFPEWIRALYRYE